MSRPNRPPRLYRQCWPVVWLAGWIVPRARREEWYGRWRHQIWHWSAFLEESGRLSPQNQYELVKHCWRAFSDAFWVRFDRDRFIHRLNHAVRAPWFALAVPLTILVTLTLVSGFFAETRLLLLPPPMTSPQQVGSVQYLGEWWSMVVPAVPGEWVQMWRKYSQTLAGISEYSLEEKRLVADTESEQVGVARVDPSFFDAVATTPEVGRFFHESESGCADCVVVSHAVWQRVFRGRGDVVGRTASLGADRVTVIGVAPRRFAVPASGVGAWRPLSGPPPARRARGMWPVGVVVRVKEGVATAEADRELRSVVKRYTYPNTFGPDWPGAVQVVPFTRRAHQTLATYGVLVLVALVAAMIAALVRFKPQRARIGRWTLFLAGKTLFALLACALFTIEFTPTLAHALGRAFDSSVWALSLWICLAMCVGVLLWSQHDQLHRCPVCLARLELPVLVGEPSRILFGRGATEFVCSRGHGLLHISDSHCSWIEPEEWTGLDPSWQTLFEDEDE